jgi:hypothetical protein
VRRSVASVNGGWKLTPWRQVKTDPWLVMVPRWWSRGRAEVAVFEAVGVALEGDDVGVVGEAVDHGRGDDIVAEHRTQRPNGLLEVTISEARS